MLVEPFDHQHGERLVFIEAVAGGDGGSPARGEPAVEVESRQRHPCAFAGKTGTGHLLAQWHRRMAEGGVVGGAGRPHRGVEHQRRVGGLLQYRRQQRRQIAGRFLGDSGDVKPCGGDPDPDQVTAAGAQGGQPARRQQQDPVTDVDRRGYPALGEDVVVHTDERFDERGSVGKPLIVRAFGQK